MSFFATKHHECPTCRCTEEPEKTMKYPITTKVTVETPDGTCSLELHNPSINLEDLMESLIIPALLGSGYSEESVEKYREGGNAMALREAREAEMRG